MRNVSAVTLAALLVAGCQTMSDVAGVVTGPSSKEAETVVAPPPAASIAAPASGAVRASGMAGMTGDALRDAWGEPWLKRVENGAELWQYGSGRTCTVLVYLYPNAGNAMAVSHAEALPGGSDETALATCAKAAGKPPLKPIS